MANTRKQTPKKKVGRKRQPPQRQRPVMRRAIGDSHAVAQAICAITDPFCDGAVSGKWPDNSMTRSICHNINGEAMYLNALSNGSGAMLLVPSNGVAYSIATSIVGATLTATFPDAVTLVGTSTPGMARWRITSWGLKVSCPLSRMTATGMLHVRMFSPDTYLNLTTTELLTTYADAKLDIPLQRVIDQDEYIIPMPLGSEARLFRSPDDQVALLSTGRNPGWQVCTVGFSGAPANQAGVIVIQAYVHLEYTPPDSNSNYMFATAPPPSSPYLQQGNASVLDRIGNFVSGAASKVEALFNSKAGQYAMAGVGGYLTAGPAGAAGALMLTNKAHARDVD